MMPSLIKHARGEALSCFHLPFRQGVILRAAYGIYEDQKPHCMRRCSHWLGAKVGLPARTMTSLGSTPMGPGEHAHSRKKRSRRLRMCAHVYHTEGCPRTNTWGGTPRTVGCAVAGPWRNPWRNPSQERPRLDAIASCFAVIKPGRRPIQEPRRRDTVRRDPMCRASSSAEIVSGGL